RVFLRFFRGAWRRSSDRHARRVPHVRPERANVGPSLPFRGVNGAARGHGEWRSGDQFSSDIPARFPISLARSLPPSSIASLRPRTARVICFFFSRHSPLVTSHQLLPIIDKVTPLRVTSRPRLPCSLRTTPLRWRILSCASRS